MSTIDDLQRLHEAATPGTWEQGCNWVVAGTHPPCARERPTCAYCEEGSAPVEVWPASAKQIAEGMDPRMVWHRHRAKDNNTNPTEDGDPFGLHQIDTSAGGRLIAGNYDYDTGGIVSDHDCKSIVALHNAWPAIHRVLVAARKWMHTDTADFDADCAADRELGEALRALDDKEQRT